jgi:hypothetical protein
MMPKPAYLGAHTASAFQEPSVVHAYQYRPAYPVQSKNSCSLARVVFQEPVEPLTTLD